MKPSHWVQIAAVLSSASLQAETSHVPGVSANRAANITAPLSFEPNQGQTDASVKFVSRGNGYTLFLTSKEAVLALRKPGNHKSVLRMKLSGANGEATVRGLAELAGKSNYFIGNDPTKWRTHIPNYSRVKYSQVYPGVDLVFYGNPGELEYDFIVAPAALQGPHYSNRAFGESQRDRTFLCNPTLVNCGTSWQAAYWRLTS